MPDAFSNDPKGKGKAPGVRRRLWFWVANVLSVFAAEVVIVIVGFLTVLWAAGRILTRGPYSCFKRVHSVQLPRRIERGRLGSQFKLSEMTKLKCKSVFVLDVPCSSMF